MINKHIWIITVVLLPVFCARAQNTADAIAKLTKFLKDEGFTGNIEKTLPQKLGRQIDPAKKELGRQIFFDKHLGLHRDNSCAGCHSPSRGYGDTQPIAIGVQSNDVVGSDRKGARNQRRTPMVINTAFYPKLMWNGRFSANSGDPFNNSQGFTFPLPEDGNFFPKSDSRFKTLLAVQGFIPFAEQPEMAGFTTLGSRTFTMPKLMPGVTKLKHSLPAAYSARLLNRHTSGASEEPDFSQFDDGLGRPVPSGYPGVPSLNSPIRHAVLEDINAIKEYRDLFGAIYPSVADGNGIEFWMIGDVLAEFQISLTFANAPIDRFARGEHAALSPEATRGAIIFFGKASCVQCHAVSGAANEMFSDFKEHVAGIPQIAPRFGKGTGNVPFRNADKKPSNIGNQDLGLWEFTENDDDVYKFRTSPLRNLALQPAYFHNGAFRDLKDAVRYHTDTVQQSAMYDPARAGVPADLQGNIGPIAPVIQRLSPRLKQPAGLTDAELNDVVAFLRDGLLDERANADKLMADIPKRVPSGAAMQTFQKP